MENAVHKKLEIVEKMAWKNDYSKTYRQWATLAYIISS